MAKYMDLSPNQVMRLVQIGDEDAALRLLGSSAIWLCAGCLTCTQRCPKKLDPAAVMDTLREMAHARGSVPPSCKKILAFHKAFLACVEKTGRMSEVPMTSLYKMLSADLFSDVTMAPRMMARGKLKLVPKVIRGRKDVARIFKACRRKGAE